jgi:hypothetical protein
MMNFPASPSIGQQYPASAIAGVPVYFWDGEKWSTKRIIADTQPSTVAPPMDGAVTPGDVLEWARGDHVHPTDSGFAPVASPTFTGGLQAAAFTFSGNLTINGSIVATATAKGHRFGDTSGQGFSAGLVRTDCNIVLYDYDGAGNWCGMGTDPNGVFFVRTGTTAGLSAAFISDAGQVCSFAQVPQAPSPGNGSNDTQWATTAFVVANQAQGGPYLPLSGGVMNGTLTVSYGHIMPYRNGATGVCYLSNGDRYIYYDGGNYILGGGSIAYSAAGRIWGTSDFGNYPISNSRLAFVGDRFQDQSEGLTEPAGGSVVSGKSGMNTTVYYTVGCTYRYRQLQSYTSGWYANGFA